MHQLLNHPAVDGIALYWLFSAFVGGMPAPTHESSAGYTWCHDSLHILAGNLSKVVASKYPQLPPGSVQITDTVQKTTTAVPEVK